MAKRRWIRQPALSPARQLAGLQARFPSGEGSVRRGSLSWRLVAKPTAFSLDYLIEVECREGSKPKVFASGGEIEKMEDLSDVPHKFSADAKLKRIQLCLDYHEWGDGDSIATTLLPWAIEWLAHFEIWLTTGKWTGGGIHDGVVEG